ncbi:MAG: PepSY domain-containing protein [Hyphomicrobiaceae bacterium]
MKIVISTVIAAALSIALAGSALADGFDKCTEEAKEKWMTEEQVSAKAVEMGYEVKKIEEEGTCYEVYGVKDGQQLEVFFNPVTAEVVHSEVKD